MDLEDIKLNEISRERQLPCDLNYTWNLKNFFAKLSSQVEHINGSQR